MDDQCGGTLLDGTVFQDDSSAGRYDQILREDATEEKYTNNE
jgi:hypothetical protein